MLNQNLKVCEWRLMNAFDQFVSDFQLTLTHNESKRQKLCYLWRKKAVVRASPALTERVKITVVTSCILVVFVRRSRENSSS